MCSALILRRWILLLPKMMRRHRHRQKRMGRLPLLLTVTWMRTGRTRPRMLSPAVTDLPGDGTRWHFLRAGEPGDAGGSVLEPERFPAAAELVLAQHVLNAEMKAGAGVVALFAAGVP